MRTYLLVHPERFPSNEDAVIGPHLPEGTPLAEIDLWYGTRIKEAAFACERRIVLLDSFGRESLEEAADWGDEPLLLEGLSDEGWELVDCEPREVGRVVRRVFKETAGEILLGGFARHDCVLRAWKALEKLGLTVSLDETGTLPLSLGGAEAYLSHLVGTAAGQRCALL